MYAQQPHPGAAAPAGPQGEGAAVVRPEPDGSDIAARMAAASAPAPPAPDAPGSAAGAFSPGPGPSAAAVPRQPGGGTSGPARPAPARSAAPCAEAAHPAVPRAGAGRRRSSRGAGPEAAARAHGAAEAHAPAGAGLGVAGGDPSDARAPRHAEAERDPGAGGSPPAAGRPGELAASPAGQAAAAASGAGAGGRRSPNAVLAWADAWEQPLQDGAGRGSSGEQGRGADDDELEASAWRERLGGLMASGGGLLARGADSDQAPGAECGAALHVAAYSGAQASLHAACNCVAHTVPPPAVRAWPAAGRPQLAQAKSRSPESVKKGWTGRIVLAVMQSCSGPASAWYLPSGSVTVVRAAARVGGRAAVGIAPAAAGRGCGCLAARADPAAGRPGRGGA